MKKWRDVVKNAFGGKQFEYSFFRTRKRCNNIFCFDVETTSFFVHPDGTVHNFEYLSSTFYEDCLKGGFVYLWALSVDDSVIYGRTIEEFKDCLRAILEIVDADILIFVHNLSFEFQFLRNILNESVDVFARKTRKTMKFTEEISDYIVEYRCSYMLTRMSLANWAEEKRLPIMKLVGEIDYNVLRTPNTRLSKKILEYSEHDVLVMYHGIMQFLEDYIDVWDIPLTQTSIVRRKYNDMLAQDDYLHRRMEKLVPSYELYKILLKAFWGGIAHASFKWVNETIYDVRSFDKKSSYPWELVSRKYPMTPFVKCRFNEKYMYNESYSYLITVELNDIESALCHSYISVSKCIESDEVLSDNGRIISADRIVITCTNVDYETILESYKVKGEKNVLDFRVSLNEYLPSSVRLFVLEWFNKKTELDGVAAMKVLYTKNKEIINAIYGMMCTKEFTDEIVYKDSDWSKDELTKEKFDVKRNKKLKKKRKLNNAFQWGVWCTAYARRSLWDSVVAKSADGRLLIDENTIYLDTDSNKLIVNDEILAWFDEYNKMIYNKQDKIAEDLGIDVKMLRPARPDGKICALGVYECDGVYEEFRTLGAKKYAYKEDGELHITVSGVRKASASQLSCIEDFKKGLVFDISHAKKNLLSYQDDQPYAIINRGKYDEYLCKYDYGVCVYPTTYSLGLEQDFMWLIKQYVELHTGLLEHDDIVKEIIKRGKEKRKTL